MLSQFEMIETLGNSSKMQSWVLDSGAASHISHDQESFSKLDSMSTASNVFIGSESKMLMLGTGCIKIARNKVISDVLYVLSVTNNLLSIRKLPNSGHSCFQLQELLCDGS